MVNGLPDYYINFKRAWDATHPDYQTRAELISRMIKEAEVVKEICWLTNFLDELKVEYQTPNLHIDNLSAISLIKNKTSSKRSKHIEVKYHFIRDTYQQKKFNLLYIDSKHQKADFLTKILSADRQKQLVESSGIVEW